MVAHRKTYHVEDEDEDEALEKKPGAHVVECAMAKLVGNDGLDFVFGERGDEGIGKQYAPSGTNASDDGVGSASGFGDAPFVDGADAKMSFGGQLSKSFLERLVGQRKDWVEEREDQGSERLTAMKRNE